MSAAKKDEPTNSTALNPIAHQQLREIAHEMRNPLNALYSVTELMADEKFGPAWG